MTRKQSPLLRIRDYVLVPLVLSFILLFINQAISMGIAEVTTFTIYFTQEFFIFWLIATVIFSVGFHIRSLIIVSITSLLVVTGMLAGYENFTLFNAFSTLVCSYLSFHIGAMEKKIKTILNYPF